MLNSAGVVVGPHDEVLEATNHRADPGRLGRGTRIGVPQVLDLVRAARRDQRVTTTELNLARGASVSSQPI